MQMDNGSVSVSSLLRMVGVMGIGVGLAWALQILGFAPEGSAFDRMVWVLAAASVCGASFGLIVMSGMLDDAGSTSSNRDAVLS